MNGRKPRSAVKVRWMRGSVMGPWTTDDDALKLQADLQREIIDCGDGYGFVAVEGFDGREVLIRGREVVAIELIRETPASVPPATTVGSGGMSGVSVQGGTFAQAYGGGQSSPGTEFLRQQAAARWATAQQVHG